jgi:hypothetical protein
MMAQSQCLEHLTGDAEDLDSIFDQYKISPLPCTNVHPWTSSESPVWDKKNLSCVSLPAKKIK